MSNYLNSVMIVSKFGCSTTGKVTDVTEGYMTLLSFSCLAMSTPLALHSLKMAGFSFTTQIPKLSHFRDKYSDCISPSFAVNFKPKFITPCWLFDVVLIFPTGCAKLGVKLHACLAFLYRSLLVKYSASPGSGCAFDFITNFRTCLVSYYGVPLS